jgi:ribosomal protein S18 acetylase RimI-like enzyme
VGVQEETVLRVRRLQKENDLQDLVALSRAFFAGYEDHHADFFRIDGLTDEEIVDYFSRFLERDDRAAFVAHWGNRIVGYVTVTVQRQPAYWRVRRVGHVSGLMVDKGHRRQGIGSQLLAQARAYLRGQGVQYYTLYTAVGNEGALAFYESQGMEPLYSHLLGEVGAAS